MGLPERAPKEDTMDPNKDENQDEKVDEVTATDEGGEPTPEEKEYDAAWDGAAKPSDDPADPDAGGDDKGLPPEEAPKETPEKTEPVSKKYGSIESMEKAVADTRKHSQELQTEVNTLKDKLAAFEKGDATQEEVDEARKGVELAKGEYDEKRKTLYEDYPELKEVIDPLVEANRALSEEVKELKSGSEEDARASEQQARLDAFNRDVRPGVLKVHSDFDSIFTERGAGPEYPVFRAWAESQGEEMVKKAFDSTDPTEIAEAVTEFKTYKAKGFTRSIADEQERKRKERQTNAQSLRGGGITMPASVKKDKNDYDSGWNEAAEIERREGAT